MAGLTIHRDLDSHLKPHQLEGISHMLEAVVGNIQHAKEHDKGHGCVLAHSMGLGKSLQVIAMLHTIMSEPRLPQFTHALIVCPKNVLYNWEKEFLRWLPKEDSMRKHIKVFDTSKISDEQSRLLHLKEWKVNWPKGILIMTFDAYKDRMNLPRRAQQQNSDTVKEAKKYLRDPGPDLVVVDEGHIICKNAKTQQAQAFQGIRTHRRIVLTGTPLQNSLTEYHGMVDFVRPGHLGTEADFKRKYADPILAGTYSDSNPSDVKKMQRTEYALREKLRGVVHRRDETVLRKELGDKVEYVLSVSLTKIQRQMYFRYQDEISELEETQGKKVNYFQKYQVFQKICNHPCAFDSKASSKKPHAATSPSAADSGDLEIDDDDYNVDQADSGIKKKWWSTYVPKKTIKDLRETSGKIAVAMELISMSIKQGDKVILFSQFTYVLDILERHLKHFGVVSTSQIIASLAFRIGANNRW